MMLLLLFFFFFLLVDDFLLLEDFLLRVFEDLREREERDVFGREGREIART